MGLRILTVAPSNHRGGAQRVAVQLSRKYVHSGHDCWLAVGSCRNSDERTIVIPNDLCGGWQGFWWKVERWLEGMQGRLRGSSRLRRMVRDIADPRRIWERFNGIEDFRFPGTWKLLSITPEPPDVLHIHNMHGDYFDLRALPWLCQRVPVILTLHDMWLITGHCAHSFDCERWKTGCGQCPDLTIYPSVKRDATAYNWRRKRDIYSKSRLYIATPSRWLMQKVEESMLAPAIVGARVIPNGVDLSVFYPAEKSDAREALGIPLGAKVLLFTANGIRRNIWKDYETMRGAVSRVVETTEGQTILFFALGESAPSELIGRASVQFVPYQKEQKMVSRYYQAADVYIHAARADTFPNTVLEALACGTPVVATAVGGIPEQIRAMEWEAHPGGFPSYRSKEATGLLTPPKHPEAMARALWILLRDRELRAQLGENAARDAKGRFDLNMQLDAYLEWFEEILSHKEELSCGNPAEMAPDEIRLSL